MSDYRKDDEDGKGRKGLKDYGIIHLTGAIDAGKAQQVCEEILEINIAGQLDQIQMIINSPGGSCADGFAVIDMMEWSRVPVYTVGLGRVASMGLLIFMAGARGRRVLTPRTSILSHRYSTLVWGKHSDLIAHRKEEDFLHQRILQHYLTYSNLKDEKELEAKLLRDVDTWLTPEEAVAFGIADIVEPLKRGPLRVEEPLHSGAGAGRGVPDAR